MSNIENTSSNEKEPIPNRHARRATVAIARRAKPNSGESIEHKVQRMRARVEFIQTRKAERAARQSPTPIPTLTKAQQKIAVARQQAGREKQRRHEKHAAKQQRNAA
jgi:hypothetical protein